MSSNNTMKLFNKFSNSLIKDFIDYLESNDISIPNDIQNSFLIDKPSKRKGKLSPYTVFMKEFRSNYQKENPEMSFQEVSQAIAQEWQRIKENPEKVKQYEEKAEKYNSEITSSKNKKICKATKGSDKQPCKAEAKNGDYCGRHKKLAFDQVDIDDEIISNISNDSISCQFENCSNNAEGGPFCSQHKKKCIKEKQNGQICGKKATKGEFCGFHDPAKSKVKSPSISSVSDEQSDIEVDIESNHEEKIMYYDTDFNIFKKQKDNCTKFIIYNDDIAYNDEGDEIGIIKNNKIELF